MSLRTTLTTLCLAATVSLALAATALGATAGSEYVPFVPGAAGEQVVGDGEYGPGSSILSPEVRGSGSDSENDAQDEEGASSSGQSNSGAVGTLTDPVALLVIAGVGAATLAMTLRRRRSLEGEPAADLAGRDPGSSPPTPDGEISSDDKD